MKAVLGTLLRRPRAPRKVGVGEEVVAASPKLPPIDLRTVQRALSVRQPSAEQIMSGTKCVEYRTQPMRAIRLYNLRLMQQGPSLNSGSHGFALADQLIRNQNEE
jgi:hypothetical protein